MVCLPEHPGWMEAALFRPTLATRFAHPYPEVATAATQFGRVLAASSTNAITRMQRFRPFLVAMAWAVSRAGVALFLLGAAERLRHAGLLSRITGD